MARPTVMTPEVIAKLEEAFAWGCTDREACLHADIGMSTLYKYQEENPKFVDRKEALKDTPVLLARKSVVRALPNDPKLSIDYLQRKKKDEFSVKAENDITLSGGATPILVEFVNGQAEDTNSD